MAASVDPPLDLIPLGHITGVSGLKGWVKVHSDTDPRENIFAFSSWWLHQAGKWKEVEVTNGRPQGKTIVVHVKGIESPEAAAQLIGAKIAVDRRALPEPADGEYYWTDLVGMQVVTVDGVAIGPVDRMFETGANDVAVVTDLRDSSVGETGDASEGGLCDVRAGTSISGQDDSSKSSTSKGSSGNGSSGKNTNREVLVPWLVPDVVTDVDLKDRRITVDWDPDF